MCLSLPFFAWLGPPRLPATTGGGYKGQLSHHLLSRKENGSLIRQGRKKKKKKEKSTPSTTVVARLREVNEMKKQGVQDSPLFIVLSFDKTLASFPPFFSFLFIILCQILCQVFGAVVPRRASSSLSH